jgi:tyrosyl-tRNA synthetase
MEFMGEKPNIGIILGILPGTDGVIKMSKSLGNHIPLRATPDDMYGKVMSIPDTAMSSFFRLVTRLEPAEIAAIERGLSGGELHPRDVKMRLAREIVAIYHGEEQVAAAEQAFRQVFQEQGVPEAIESYSLSPEQTVTDVLVASGLAATRSAARRLVEQKAVRLEDQLLEDASAVLSLSGEAVLRAGKRKFVRLIPRG